MMFLVCGWMMLIVCVAVLIVRLLGSLALEFPVTERIEQQEGYPDDEHDDNYFQLVAEMVRLVMVSMGAVVRCYQFIHLLYLRHRKTRYLLMSA